VRPDESNVDKTKWGILDLGNDAVAIPLNVEDNAIVEQEVGAAK